MEKSPYRSTVRKISSAGKTPTRINTLQAPLVLGSGVASLRSHGRVNEIKNTTQKERKEMRGLNDKLANHIERVRFLEGENTYFRDLLWKSKCKLNIDVIKESYHAEVNILKADIRRKDVKLAALQSKGESLEETVDYLCAQTNHLQDRKDEMGLALVGLNEEVSYQIHEGENYRRRINDIEKRLTRSKDRYDLLLDQMKTLTSDLQDETTQRLFKDACVQSLEDEFAFSDDINAAEMKEYRSLLSKMKNQPSLCETPKAEIGSIVSELSKEYESQLKLVTTHLEERHNAELNELRLSVQTTNTNRNTNTVDSCSKDKESLERLFEYEDMISKLSIQMKSVEAEVGIVEEKRMKEVKENQSTINGLRSEIEVVLKQLSDLNDSKLTLEAEISTYRKLLDGDDTRVDLEELLTTVNAKQTESENIPTIAPFLLTVKIKVERTRQGTVSIIELDPEGKYIELEDMTSEKKRDMTNWTLTQTVENGESCTHTFTDDNVFTSGKLIKIWGHKHGYGESGIVSSTVSEWSALSKPSTIILKQKNNKICAGFQSTVVFE